jgi:hypothetical protein
VFINAALFAAILYLVQYATVIIAFAAQNVVHSPANVA